MSVLYRARGRSLACLVGALVAVGALVSATTAGATPAPLVTGSTYLAVGDSLTYGFHAKQFPKNWVRKASPKRKTTKKASSTTSAPR